MEIFVSKYFSKLDDKRRVSIPFQFRNLVESKGNSQIFAYSSLVNKCIEVCTEGRLQKLYAKIEDMDMFSKDRDTLATAILAGGEVLSFDSKGRVMLGSNLIEHAGIKKEVIIVGKGPTFEIWDKDEFDVFYKTARMSAQDALNINGEGKA